MSREARCPRCGNWSPIAIDETGLGFWWKDSADCPRCGATVLVETECDHRGGLLVSDHREAPAPKGGSDEPVDRGPRDYLADVRRMDA